MPTGGYDTNEALGLLELCIQLNGDGVNKKISSYRGPWGKPLLTSVIKDPFDNAWSLWQKGKRTFAIVVRGTIAKEKSIIEDLLAETIPADGGLALTPDSYLPLSLVSTETKNAAVHMGFAWGMAVILFHKTQGIISKAGGKLGSGPADIYITGHSQGAAIATLLHSFFYYADKTKFPWLKGKNFKSYVFAQPKPGNWQYMMDFARAAANDGLAHCINNPLDWVPQLPLSRQGFSDIVGDSVAPYLRGRKHPILADIAASVAGELEKIRMGKSAVNDEVAGWAVNLAKNIDSAHTVSGTPNGSGGGNLDYMPCGSVRSTPMRADLRGIVPDAQGDGLAQHHLFTYKTLLEG
ncbi:MAG: lipase family protein [Elusimicrobiota bacterium]